MYYTENKPQASVWKKNLTRPFMSLMSHHYGNLAWAIDHAPYGRRANSLNRGEDVPVGKGRTLSVGLK